MSPFHRRRRWWWWRRRRRKRPRRRQLGAHSTVHHDAPLQHSLPFPFRIARLGAAILAIPSLCVCFAEVCWRKREKEVNRAIANFLEATACYYFSLSRDLCISLSLIGTEQWQQSLSSSNSCCSSSSCWPTVELCRAQCVWVRCLGKVPNTGLVLLWKSLSLSPSLLASMCADNQRDIAVNETVTVS